MAMMKGSVPRGTLPFLVLASLVTSAIAFGEAVHAVAAALSHRRLPMSPPNVADPTGRHKRACAVVVLGFADRGPRPNIVNRWRARIAVRSARSAAASGERVVVVCCGGAVKGETPEAALLAEAVRELGWDGSIRLDQSSTTTWENIEQARRLVGGVDRIIICSNGLHAAKAREYLRRQDPHLAGLLAPADEYRLGEMTFVKPVFAAVGLWKLIRARRST
jgi:hypothetical protein